MKIWTTALAVMMAGAMMAATSFAQGAGGGGSAPGPSTRPEGAKPGSPPPPSGSTGTPTAQSASPGDSTKSDAMKSESTSDAMKSEKAASGAAEAEQVKAVQQALKDKGFDPGEVDGMMGPKTRAALRDFQQKEGLKASGRLDTETMAKLGVEKAGAPPSASPATGAGGKK